MQRELLDSRAPSPWDKFSVSPSPRTKGLEIEMRRSDGVPRLTPEVEQGNVEYKLILVNPSPERLQKLVTQMNWRLMEGNGQAYYQLGVADSGELVGLTRREMEATLETLENMAGELGASVLINREIEIRGRFTALSLESVKGMNPGRERSVPSTPLSTSVTSTDVTTTDTEASELEGNDEPDGDNTDSPDAGMEAPLDDPDEVIVRSAPVPIAHSFLRRRNQKQREKTLRPVDLSPESVDDAVDPFDEGDADDEDPRFGAFDLTDLGSNLPSASNLDPDRPAKSKQSKPIKPPKAPKRPKGSKPPTATLPPKTPEQVAQKLADKRAKRDRRREERKRALMDPVYDHSALLTQGSGEHGIEYDKIVSQGDNDDQGEGMAEGALHSPESASHLTSSLVTLKRDETIMAPEGNSTSSVELDHEGVGPVATDEPRLIVEALVVRKAGFGRGFVDLSQFDEELRHLPSFSLS
ncbi:hypothetical protein FRC17_009143 [Serendipita sp. 399]|nr:hypothetical protein FRC17_009143 [Serendipita sp. 399]